MPIAAADTASHEAGHWRRALLLVLACALVATILLFDPVYDALRGLLVAAAPSVAANPVAGALLFVVLSAMSAMLAFFSSTVLVPVAVYSFGKSVAAALLWTGWVLGGLVAYSIGRWVGRPLLAFAAPARTIDHWRERLPPRSGFVVALLLQAALPSEIPGYLFGIMRMRLVDYLAALALVQAPYAVAMVYVGERVVDREFGSLVALGLGMAVLSLGAIYLLRRRLRRETAARLHAAE